MALVSSTVPNLINGVSQQPDTIRLTSQGEAVENAFPSVVEGLKKRAPTEHIARLITGTLGDVYMHTINRDSNERYIVLVLNGDIRVFNILSGEEVNVNFEEITDTLIDDAVATTPSDSVQIYLPPEVTEVTLTTSGIATATVVWEVSATGAFGGEETVLRTDTTDTDASVAFTSGNYIRANLSSYTSGTVNAVVKSNKANYLQMATPSEECSSVTIADYTFLVNKTVSPVMDASTSATNDGEGIVFVKQAVLAVTYKVFIDGTERATYTTPSSGTISTVAIASDLASDLTSAIGADYTITRERSTVHIVKNDGTDFELKVEDTRSGTALNVAKNKIQKFSDLPTVAPKDFLIEVIGDNTSNFDNYYVKFEPINDDATFDEGVWNETVAPGIQNTLDASTMPHSLVREANGEFTFKKVEWSSRIAGDETSAANPSFIGRSISDLFFFKNRLGLLAGDNVILSEAGQFFNFYPTTVTTILDSNPIDVAASGNFVATLFHAVPFDEKLLLFSDQAQFTFEGGDILTPNTASIALNTQFEADNTAKPVGAGRNVYFGVKKGEFTGVREYFVDTDTNQNDAADVTAHVPKYVPKDLRKLAASNNEDILVAVSKTTQDAVYPYKYFWNGNEKLQSAWFKWTFNDASILNVDFIESDMYLVIQRSDGVYLESMRIEEGLTDNTSTPYLTHLDRRVTEADCSAVTYDSVNNETTWTLPYDTNSGANYRIVTRTDGIVSQSPGIVLQGVTLVGSNQIKASGNWTASDKLVYIGERYQMRYQFSNQVVKESQSEGGQVLRNDGRLMLRTFSVVYDDTGFFEAKVTHNHRDTPSVYTFSGRTLGSSTNAIGSVSISSGTHKFVVLGKSDEVTIELINDSHLPSAFLSAEWEGDFTSRTQARV